MKKLFIVTLLVLALIMSMFTSCAEKEPEPLRICVDITYVTGYGDAFKPVNEVMTDFLTRLENAGGPTDVVVECVPSEGAERETVIDRLRVEIASGGGPDVFIMSCDNKSTLHTQEALFVMPEKSMNLGVFLPLDEYMENSTQYTEWDKLNQIVLEVGKNSEGQQIIPLAYAMPVSVYKQEEVTHVPDMEITWDDMLKSDDISLRAAAVWTDNVWTDNNDMYTDSCPFIWSEDALPEFILGNLADYSEEELLFTESELSACIEDIFALGDCYLEGEFADAPLHYNEFIGKDFDGGITVTDSDGNMYNSCNGIKPYDSMTLIPLYSDDGGVTASITSFAAVNRNTLRPEEAYAIIDFLLSADVQRSGGIYSYLFRNDTYSLPMHNELMNGKENSLYEWSSINLNLRNLEWYMTEENFVALSNVRDQITHVRFRDALDIEFDKLYWDYHRAVTSGENTEEVVAEHYRIMQQILRE